jgi:hypothetical protein
LWAGDEEGFAGGPQDVVAVAPEGFDGVGVVEEECAAG